MQCIDELIDVERAISLGVGLAWLDLAYESHIHVIVKALRCAYSILLIRSYIEEHHHALYKRTRS